MGFKDYYDKYENELAESFRKHVEEMEDSLQHKTKLLSSDKAFFDYCQEQYVEFLADSIDAAEDAIDAKYGPTYE